MSREAMTVVYWTKPEKRRDAEGTWADTGGQVATRVHVSRDAESCVRAGYPVGRDDRGSHGGLARTDHVLQLCVPSLARPRPTRLCPPL